ncbi:hypothetical protein HYV43_06875 [Candidatus Micrarchaeota archaeon]|nr:hypothetical protein [Candidatus Micrarchaeota archaeon]
MFPDVLGAAAVSVALLLASLLLMQVATDFVLTHASMGELALAAVLGCWRRRAC